MEREKTHEESRLLSQLLNMGPPLLSPDVNHNKEAHFYHTHAGSINALRPKTIITYGGGGGIYFSVCER